MYRAKNKFTQENVFVKKFKDFKSRPVSFKDCVLLQIEKQRRLGSSDCFVRIFKYVITNNDLYVISEQCEESLKARILANSPP